MVSQSASDAMLVTEVTIASTALAVICQPDLGRSLIFQASGSKYRLMLDR